MRLHRNQPSTQQKQPANQRRSKSAEGNPNRQAQVRSVDQDFLQSNPVSEQGLTTATANSSYQPQPLIQTEAKETLQMKAEAHHNKAARQVSQRVHRLQGSVSPLQAPDLQKMDARASTVFNKDQNRPESSHRKRLPAYEPCHIQQDKTGVAGIQRSILYDEADKIVGYQINMGKDLPVPFLELTQSLSTDGELTSIDLYQLRAWAINNRGTVNELMRLFMAGLLDTSFRARFNELTLEQGASFELPFSVINDRNKKRVQDLNREIDWTEIDKLEMEIFDAHDQGNDELKKSKKEELQSVITQQIMAMAGERYQESITQTLAYAKAKGVAERDILDAMVYAASDSTQADRAFAAQVFVIAKSESLDISDRIQYGEIYIDAMAPGAMKSYFDESTHAAYYTMAGGEIMGKGDTIYVMNNMDINGLYDRSAILHELEHARQDSELDKEAPVQEKNKLVIEFNAYRKQAQYLLGYLAKMPGEERTQELKSLAKEANYPVIAVMVYSTLDDPKTFEPIVVELLTHFYGSEEEASKVFRERIDKDHKTILRETMGIIHFNYGLGEEDATKNYFYDGLAGSSMLDWKDRF